MLPLAFFRNRLFAGSTFVSMASAFVFYGLLFVFSLFYRQVRGAAARYGACVPADDRDGRARRAGFGQAGCTLWRARHDVRGVWAYAAGALGMTGIGATTPAWLAVAPMLAIGFASGFISPAATSPALGTVDRRRAGVAAAALNAARQSGSALGVAIFGACIATLQPFPAAMRVALGIATGLSALAAATWWITARPTPASGEPAAPLQTATRR